MKQKKKANSVGRPTKRTEQVVSKLLFALQNYLPFDKACDYAMIGDATIYRWMKEDHDFERDVKCARSQAEMDMTGELKKKDPKYWLQCMDPQNFKADPTPYTENSFRVIVQTDAGREQLAAGRLTAEQETTSSLPKPS